MSLFNWLFRDQAPQQPAMPESSGLSRMEATRPAVRRSGQEVPFSNAQPANRKGERIARRELLYSVVREAMMRAEVLSPSYKFKVLSLDSGGRQYIIMMDLAHEKGKQSGWLAEMESQMVRRARKSHDITVMAVYWRIRQTAVAGAKSGSELNARQNQSR